MSLVHGRRKRGCQKTMSMKGQTVLIRPSLLFKGKKKAKLCLWCCYSFVTKKHLISSDIFFEIEITVILAWPGTGAHYPCFNNASRFVRLHTLGRMVPQFAYRSIGTFLHPYESHLPSTPVKHKSPSTSSTSLFHFSQTRDGMGRLWTLK